MSLNVTMSGWDLAKMVELVMACPNFVGRSGSVHFKEGETGGMHGIDGGSQAVYVSMA